MNKPESGQARQRDIAIKDWTSGSIFKNLLLLSWPMIISNIMVMTGPTIDMIWVGRLGPDSIAAVGVSGIIVMFIMTAMMGVAIGARALIARFIGMKQPNEAVRVARQAFLIAMGLSVVIATAGIILSDGILALMGVEAEVLRLGSAYLKVNFCGAVIMSSGMICENIMQSSGDTITPMVIGIISKVFHVALSPLFIFGWLFVPGLGVVGAALANVCSLLIGLAASLFVLFTGKTQLHLHLKGMRIDFALMWRILKIGIPGVVMMAQKNLSNLIVMKIIVHYGTLAVAAHTVLQRVEMIFFMAGVGMGSAAGVLAGQNLGAGQPERAGKSGIYAIGIAETFVIIACALAFIFPTYLISVFTQDPELIEVTTVFLRIGVVGYLMCGLEPVFLNFFTGVGDTTVPMTFEVGTTWCLLLPMAIIFPKLWGLEVLGVRWAMALSFVMLTCGYVILFS
ncbi:MAG: MATE family efflux transporter, partial [Deltaproteobacteria bacterium]|nr:MATE family efflux transporter [Deltaproteobacteria bacterium]